MPVASAPAPAQAPAKDRRGRAELGPGRLLAFAHTGKPPRRFFLPELDALRLFAFLMVWSCHSLPSAGECLSRSVPGWLAAVVGVAKETGNLGVPVFFFLSAYLITELLRREQEATGTIALRNFYVRRVLRIWPLYLGVLAAYGLLGLRFHGFRIEPGRLLASVLMAGNWYIALHPAILTPLRALWSISVEEQFYAAWPLLARWASRRVFLGVCAALVVVAQGILVYMARGGAPGSTLHVTAWVNSFVQFQFFALGAVVALLQEGAVPRAGRMLRGMLLAGGVGAMVCAAGVFGIKHAQAAHGAGSLCLGYGCAGAGCVLLLFGTLGVRQGGVPPAVQKLGQVSFGLYVFHETGYFLADALTRHGGWWHSGTSASGWAVSLAVNKGMALAITVGMALVSYQFWERPFLRWKERFTTVRSREA